ncbi:MAG: CdaR family protein [Myxococcota bacterium]|nr:CdaR family protein [Myxococcota bacterium]
MFRPTHNSSLKVFSLAVAVLLFISVSGDNTTAVEVEFPVEYKMAKGFAVVGSAPGRIRAQLQGPWANFRSFDSEALTPVVVDLSERSDQDLVRHRVSMRDLKPPGGMKVLSFGPSEWNIEIDRVVERMVPVSADFSTRPAFGFEIVNVLVKPAQVRVTGPLSMLRGLEAIRTRPIDIREREEDLTLEVELRPPVHPLKLRDRQVTVSVDIGEEFVQRGFQAVPVEVDNGVAGLTMREASVTLVLRGPRRIVDKIDKSALRAYVDVADEVRRGRTEFYHAVKARDLPERTQIVAPIPKVKLGFSSESPGK